MSQVSKYWATITCSDLEQIWASFGSYSWSKRSRPNNQEPLVLSLQMSMWFGFQYRLRIYMNIWKNIMLSFTNLLIFWISKTCPRKLAHQSNSPCSTFHLFPLWKCKWFHYWWILAPSCIYVVEMKHHLDLCLIQCTTNDLIYHIICTLYI